MTATVTVITSVEGFLDFVTEKYKRRTVAIVYTPAETEATALRAATEDMPEGEFMATLLDQMETGKHAPTVRLTPAQMAEIEDERIGEEIIRQPWLW